jgi:D-xylulose reductase
MIEPLAVGVHSVANIAGVKAGQTVAVFGAGPVGLLCMAVAKGGYAHPSGGAVSAGK